MSNKHIRAIVATSGLDKAGHQDGAAAQAQFWAPNGLKLLPAQVTTVPQKQSSGFFALAFV